jgi:hypothetical protein
MKRRAAICSLCLAAGRSRAAARACALRVRCSVTKGNR